MTTDPKHSDVVVIGAGLSGLSAALLLNASGLSVKLLEANDSPGGRIRSIIDPDNGDFLGDLGPTWVWPEHQPILASWLEKLQLESFAQYDTGNTIVDYGPGKEPQAGFIPGQSGNKRIVGGPQALIESLRAKIPSSAVKTNSVVKNICPHEDRVQLTCENGDTCTATHVILAAPPRILLETIECESFLDSQTISALRSVPTWMAHHAKAVAVFDEPFWRMMGLSGRIVSTEGPLMEAHDHSGPDGAPAAIFGFVGWPHDMRKSRGIELEQDIRLQLIRCFGEGAKKPVSINIEDWSSNRFAASQHDLASPMPHPTIGPDILRQSCGGGKIWFASAEAALQSPGLIEGAIESAQRAATNVLNSLKDD